MKIQPAAARLCARSACLGLLLVGCGASREETRRLVHDELSELMKHKTVIAGDGAAPYSAATGVGGFLFVSGTIGVNDQGQLQPESFEAEARRVFAKLGRILGSQGQDFRHVMSVTVYLKDLGDYERMNAIYAEYFARGNYPARVTVQVSDLPRHSRIEIALVAFASPP